VISRELVASSDPDAGEAALAWLEKSYRQRVLNPAEVDEWLSGKDP
jgi:formylmethanofuran dehydrogenase subunit A